MGGSRTCCHPISLTKEEDFTTAAKGLDSLLICSSESQLVNSRRCGGPAWRNQGYVRRGLSLPSWENRETGRSSCSRTARLISRPLERLDQLVRGTAPGETGALVARLQETCCVSWQGPGATTAKISTN